MRTLSLVVLVGLAAASGAAAQAPIPSQGTSLIRTRVMLELDSLCRSGKPPSRDPTFCPRLQAFVANPLDTTAQREPALDTVFRDMAFRNLVLAEQTQVAVAPAGGAVAASPDIGSALVFGMTDFLLSRARDEVVTSFFAKVKEQFAKDPSLQKLFPSTWGVIQQVESLGYRALLSAIQAALDADLQSLPANLPAASSLLGAGASAKWLQAGAAFAGPVRAIAAGEAPLTALGSLASLSETAVPDVNLRNALRLIGKLAAEAGAGVQAGPGTPAISESLTATLGRPRDRNVFLAVVLQDLNVQPRSLPQASTSLESIVARLAELRVVIQREQNKDLRDPESSQRVAAVLVATVGVLREVQPFLSTGDTADVRRALDLADKLGRAVASRDWGPFVVEVLKVVPKLDPKVARLVVLGAALASAQTPAQVTDALTAAADPVGSFRARRQSGHWTFAIVSYFGAQTGLEWLPDVAGKGTGGWQGGLALPVGLEFAKGCGSASVGLYVSILDLGTLASYRLSNKQPASTTVNTGPNTSFAQLFAPGISLMFGLTRDLPMSLGVGLEYAPRLRDTGAGAANVLRASVFFGVDLTLFRF